MKSYNYLLQQYFGHLSPQELSVLLSYFHEEKLRKNEFFTTTDKRCDRLSIVKSGILRVFALSDGKEITQWISTENYLLTEVMGFFFNQPNRWTIQAFTDTELLTISKANYLKMCQDFPKWNEIEKTLIVKCFGMIEDRIFTLLSKSAEERYDLYFEQNSELFNQVPLKHIASVLGMTAETLSRIRKRHSETS